MTQEIHISQGAVDAINNFAGHEMPYESIMRGVAEAVAGFMRRYQHCAFYQKYNIHPAPIFCLKDDGFDEDDAETLYLHLIRDDNGWGVGTPDELPLPNSRLYWIERAIDEAKAIMKASE